MKRLLVCLDLSPRAAHVLDVAIDLAKRTGAKLTLFRSVGVPPELGHDVIGLTSNEIVERLNERARTDLAAFAAKVPPELLDATKTHLGVPWDAIVREAQSIEADMIIIGSHGYSTFDRLIGTTAAKIVNHADRSVLVVR